MNVWVILLLCAHSLLLATLLAIPFVMSLMNKARQKEIKKWIPQGILISKGYQKSKLKKMVRQGKIEQRFMKTADGQVISCYKFPTPKKKKNEKATGKVNR